MRYSELPGNYQALEDKFTTEMFDDPLSDLLVERYFWDETPQGFDFWFFCTTANNINELPKIPPCHN